MKLIVGKWWFRAVANTMGEYGKGKGERNRGKWNVGNLGRGTAREKGNVGNLGRGTAREKGKIRNLGRGTVREKGKLRNKEKGEGTKEREHSAVGRL